MASEILWGGLYAADALLEGRAHRGRLRPHPAPQAEGLRGLLDQHPESLYRECAAGLPREAHEGHCRAPVRQVVAHGVPTDRARRDGRYVAREAGGGGIQDDIEGSVADV